MNTYYIMSDTNSIPTVPPTQTQGYSTTKYGWAILFVWELNEEFPFSCVPLTILEAQEGFPSNFISGPLSDDSRKEKINVFSVSTLQHSVFAKVEHGKKLKLNRTMHHPRMCICSFHCATTTTTFFCLIRCNIRKKKRCGQEIEPNICCKGGGDTGYICCCVCANGEVWELPDDERIFILQGPGLSSVRCSYDGCSYDGCKSINLGLIISVYLI